MNPADMNYISGEITDEIRLALYKRNKKFFSN